MANIYYKDNKNFVFNIVDNTVIANPDPVAGPAGKFSIPCWPGIICQFLDGFNNAVEMRRRDLA